VKSQAQTQTNSLPRWSTMRSVHSNWATTIHGSCVRCTGGWMSGTVLGEARRRPEKVGPGANMIVLMLLYIAGFPLDTGRRAA
jgi:hypothetical protein